MSGEGDEELGVLLYGYDRAQSMKIKEYLGDLTGCNIAAYGGSGREGDKILGIIEGEPRDDFNPGDVKVLMFLGFSEAQIRAALRSFPNDRNLPRPIFCTPTENNLNWLLSELLEHLLEEQRYWKERGRGQK